MINIKNPENSRRIPSLGTANNIKRVPSTHPLTWRLNSDGTPVWLEEYINKEGYVGARKAITQMTPEEVASLVTESGLKGRGGAGFKTGVKWRAKVEDVGYLLCNADEMEPNTYKDRLLLEQEPHLLIEGMIIAAYANYLCCGYIFLRGEYVDAARILNLALSEARTAGIIGKNLYGSGFDFELVVHTGAGRYICGEETALINSLEGRRANPRGKPPFPGKSGLWGKPTVVNNVETLCGVSAIIVNGIDWYKRLCRNGSYDPGTKLMGFSGKVNNPGLWEFPLGITAREVLEDYAGGMRSGYKLKSWQPGGASTGFLLPEHLDVQMYSGGISQLGTRIGTAIALAVDDSISMVSLLLNMEEFFARESCGFCTPCREGLPWTVKLLRTLECGKGSPSDIELLIELTKNLGKGKGKAFCSHAPGAREPLCSAIKYFRQEFYSLLKSK